MSEAIQKHSRMPRRYTRRTLRKREQQALMGGMGNLDGVDAKGLLELYASGHKVRELAKQYGVQPITIYQFFLRNVPEDWLAAQKARAIAMKEGGEDGLDDAADPLEVAKAREKLRAGQWDLERVDRKNYGRDDANININVFDLGDRLRRARERTQAIEHSEAAPIAVDYRAPARNSEELADQAEAVEAGDQGSNGHVRAQQISEKPA